MSIRCLWLVCEHVCVSDHFQCEITHTCSYIVSVDIFDYILTLYSWKSALHSTYFMYGVIVAICTAVGGNWKWITYIFSAVKWAQFDSSGWPLRIVHTAIHICVYMYIVEFYHVHYECFTVLCHVLCTYTGQTWP